MDLKIGTIRGRFGSHDNGTIWLWLPSKYIVGSDVVARIHKNNGESIPSKIDLIEIILDILEHETIHFVIQKLTNRFVSASFDRTQYVFDEANKINKLNKG